MSWLRLEAAFFQNPTLIRAGWDGTVVFLAAMTMSKLHGWDGAVPKEEFDEAIIRRHLGCHSDINIDAGIAGCLRAGLFTEDATHYAIRNWRKFQPDPTAADRQRRSRANRTDENASQDVTVTNGDNRESRTTGRDVRDVRTDGHAREDARSLDCASRSSGSQKTKRATKKQRACADGIIDILCQGADGATAQQQALVWRRLSRSGALGDAIVHEILDRWLKRFPGAAAKGKRESA